MIPTLIIVGLALGKWWRVVVPVAAIGWVISLIASGVGAGLPFALSAALFGLANVTLGALVFQGARLGVHRATAKNT